MTKNRFLSILVLVIASIAILGSIFGKVIVEVLTQYLWLKSVSYEQVFKISFFTKLLVGIPTVGFVFGVLFGYIKILLKNYYKLIGRPESKVVKVNNYVAVFYSVFFAISYGANFASSLWLKLLMFKDRVNFGYADPIYGHDIGFYIYTYPIIKSFVDFFIILFFWMIITTLGFYLVMFRTHPPTEGKVIYLSVTQTKGFSLKNILEKNFYSYLIKKIAILGSIIFVLIGFNYILKGYELLFSPRGVAFGASYTDINVTLNFYRALVVVSFISAVTIYFGFVKKSYKIAVSGPVIFVVIGIISVLSAGLVQQFVVEPDEISKETMYLGYNIENTQAAFDLRDVEGIDFNVDQNLSLDKLEINDEIVSNIRINDSRPLKQTYNEIQGIRLYYQFNDVDLDRYTIDGQYREVFISAREMNQDRLADKAKTWINEHLVYTHGYGVVLSPVNVVNDDGQPELMVKNIPPITDTDIMITRPEIYFGEKMDNYIVVNTEEKEFDYPKEDEYQTTVYQGNEGIELNTFNKTLFALRQKSMKLFLANKINDNSRIIINRNIFTRVKQITPYLEFDNNPYIAIGKSGRLYWIMDGFTTSNLHPYSQPFKFEAKYVNYIRNSVKVVIDAYSGETSYYVFDDKDPLLSTYSNIYPDVFKDKSEMPDGLMDHIRYPQEFFRLQSEVYKTYHIDNPLIFYNGEDIWDIATEKYMSEVQQVRPNYMSFQMPNSKGIEFLLTLPYTPREKANMTSLFIARNDGDNYGKLTLLKFPKDKTVHGPMMIESRIDQDSTISPQLTLWSQEGSNVLRGNILVVPIESSLLYVEPIYLEADNTNNLPEMKMVIVAYEDKVIMEETLAKALEKIFGVKTPTSGDTGVSTSDTTPILSESAINNLIDQLEKTIENSRTQLDKLSDILKQIKENNVDTNVDENEATETTKE